MSDLPGRLAARTDDTPPRDERATKAAPGEEETPSRRDALLDRFVEELVRVTPGEGDHPARFRMGDDEGPETVRPEVEITLSGAFRIGKYEVTQELWQLVTGEDPSRWKGPRNSVERISYDDAVAFCEELTKALRESDRIGRDEVVRLPSEAEWEYCARAGSTTRWSFGDDVGDLDAHGWYTGNAAGNDPPVGAKSANPWGLHDVHGYLWEWCADSWSATHAGADPRGAPRREEGARRRVLRGGSWRDDAHAVASSSRRPADPGLRDDAVGLRVVLSRAPKARDAGAGEP